MRADVSFRSVHLPLISWQLFLFIFLIWIPFHVAYRFSASSNNKTQKANLLYFECAMDADALKWVKFFIDLKVFLSWNYFSFPFALRNDFTQFLRFFIKKLSRQIVGNYSDGKKGHPWRVWVELRERKKKKCSTTNRYASCLSHSLFLHMFFQPSGFSLGPHFDGTVMHNDKLISFAYFHPQWQIPTINIVKWNFNVIFQ